MNNLNHLSRKQFIQNAAIAVAGASLPLSTLSAKSINPMHTEIKSKMLKFKNVRLEIGFIYDEADVIGTKTDLFYIEVENGKISKIGSNQANADAIDAKGLLMLPSFRDMHIHLDKTFYGDKWQAIRRGAGGVKGMIALEQKILPFK